MSSSFRNNIQGADLADMQLLSKFNKGFGFLLCVFGIYSKYAWVILLKDKKGVSILNAFQQIQSQTKYGQTKKGNFIMIHLKMVKG